MRRASAADRDAALGDRRPTRRQQRRQRREALLHDLEGLEIAAVDADQDRRLAPRRARARRSIARHLQIARVERLQQHEQAVLGRDIQQLRDSRARQHSQDHQHAARAGGARFQYLVGIDQEILAHRRHAERRQHRRGLAQMLERSVETRGLGQHRHRRGAAARVGRDAPQPILARVAERARRPAIAV